MRQCKCGGIIRQHQLTGDREAWTCNACGRYEAVQRQPSPQPIKPPEKPEGRAKWTPPN